MTTVEILKEMAFTATETQRRALEDAISVLSAEGDLISRQAVLDALKEHRVLYCDNTPDTFSKLSYAEKSRVDEIDTAIATIVNLPSVENKGEWIPCREREPHGLSFVALDEFNNYPWVCNSLFTWKDKDGVKHFYDATGYQDTIFQGDVKAFLRGKKIQTVGGRTFYVRPPEIVAWMPLPRWMDYKPEPYKAEKPETCKGCLEPCIMYEPDMRACKKKVREVIE